MVGSSGIGLCSRKMRKRTTVESKSVVSERKVYRK